MTVIILWMKTSKFIFQKKVKKTKTNPQHKTLRAQQLQVANNTPHQANKYYKVSKTLTFSLASSDVYSNTHSQIQDLGIKKALACSFENKTELQSWAFPAAEGNAGLTSWVTGYFSPTVPMLLNCVGKGTTSSAQTTELVGITEPNIQFPEYVSFKLTYPEVLNSSSTLLKCCLEGDTGWEVMLNHKGSVSADTTQAKLSKLAVNTIYQHTVTPKYILHWSSPVNITHSSTKTQPQITLHDTMPCALTGKEGEF